MNDEHDWLVIFVNYNNDLGEYVENLDHGDKPLKDAASP
jgi:hypothetical protein